MMMTLLCTTALLAATAVAALPPGTLSMDMIRMDNQSAYGIQLSIGTPPQIMTVKIDTGSPYLGLAGATSNWCTLPKKPCARYGSYNNKTSSTAKYVDDVFNDLLIDHGYGDDIADVVRAGGKTFPQIEFGVISYYAATYPAPHNVYGLIGLTPSCYKNGSCTETPTFQQRLIKRGYIKRNLISVYLGDETKTAKGQLLFGAVDLEKQLTKPVTFPVIPPTDVQRSNGSPNVVPVSSVSLVQASKIEDGGAMTSYFNISKGSYSLLDTGSPHFYLPHPVWLYVKKYFHLSESTDFYGMRAVDCKFRQAQKDGASLFFGFAKDKLQIGIPMERLVTQLAPGKCVTAVEDCQSYGEDCDFGDPFLRSAYTTFDFDALTVTMSNVRYTNKTRIIAA